MTPDAGCRQQWPRYESQAQWLLGFMKAQKKLLQPGALEKARAEMRYPPET
jgi:hypothetical protein